MTIYLLSHSFSMNANPGIGIDRSIITSSAASDSAYEMSRWDTELAELNPTGQIFMPNMQDCYPVPDDQRWRVPDVVMQGKTKWKKLPDTMIPAGQWIISERFHDLLVEFDPEGHQFFPVTIVNEPTGEPYDGQGQFYFWKILTPIYPFEFYDLAAMEAAGLAKWVVTEQPDGKPFTSMRVEAGDSEMILKSRYMSKGNVLRLSHHYDKATKTNHSTRNYIVINEVVFDEIKKRKIGSLDLYEFKKYSVETPGNSENLEG
jgi:hypothetical protein